MADWPWSLNYGGWTSYHSLLWQPISFQWLIAHWALFGGRVGFGYFWEGGRSWLKICAWVLRWFPLGRLSSIVPLHTLALGDRVAGTVERWVNIYMLSILLSFLPVWSFLVAIRSFESEVFLNIRSELLLINARSVKKINPWFPIILFQMSMLTWHASHKLTLPSLCKRFYLFNAISQGSGPGEVGLLWSITTLAWWHVQQLLSFECLSLVVGDQDWVDILLMYRVLQRCLRIIYLLIYIPPFLTQCIIPRWLTTNYKNTICVI